MRISATLFSKQLLKRLRVVLFDRYLQRQHLRLACMSSTCINCCSGSFRDTAAELDLSPWLRLCAFQDPAVACCRSSRSLLPCLLVCTWVCAQSRACSDFRSTMLEYELISTKHDHGTSPCNGSVRGGCPSQACSTNLSKRSSRSGDVATMLKAIHKCIPWLSSSLSFPILSIIRRLSSSSVKRPLVFGRVPSAASSVVLPDAVPLGCPLVFEPCQTAPRLSTSCRSRTILAACRSMTTMFSAMASEQSLSPSSLDLCGRLASARMLSMYSCSV
jgi:hypothetical protein